MKKIIFLFFLFFSISFYGQNDTLSIVKSENISIVCPSKMNIVYRGLQNPILIAVPNCKSFEVTGNGLSKDSKGNYILSPGQGLETIVNIDIVLKDGSLKREKHTFRIKNMPHLYGAINGLTCKQSILLISKKELRKAKLSIEFPNHFLYELKFNLVSFAVNINEKYFYINGNQLSEKALDAIEKLPLNSIFDITNFKSDFNCTNCSTINIQPVKIMIVDDKYYSEEE